MRKPYSAGIYALCAAAAFAPVGARAQSAPAPALASAPPPPAATEPPAWQVRETAYFALLKKVAAGDPEANQTFKRTLSEFETNPMSRTPMENMDIIGTVYLAKDGLEKSMVLMAMNATLGWYDALRYGSETARAEIVNDRHFFFRPIMLSGQATSQQAIAFAKEHPTQIRDSVELGISLAEKLKDTPTYDHTWPTAYGHPPTTSALGGSTPSTPLPDVAWAQAWEDAKQRVRSYYAVSGPNAAQSSPPNPAAPAAPPPLECSAEVRNESTAGDVLFRDMLFAPGGVGLADQALHPAVTERKLVRIEVIAPYTNGNVGQERWTIEHSPDDSSTYLVQFNPDGRGGTNFSVRMVP